MVKARLYSTINNNSVQCNACAHQCKISPNQLGICGVRKNIKGELFLLVYGQTTGAAIDPIEKKPLYHFLPGTSIFSIGTIGCNFHCGFCQNWEISQNRISTFGLHQLQAESETWEPEQIVNYCLSNRIASIAFTYNEPTIFIEYALDTIKLAKKNNIKTVFVSNGYQSEASFNALVKACLSAINIDLKSFSDNYYQKFCRAKLNPVLKNIQKFFESGVWTEVTTLIVPGENDTKKELTSIARFLYNISPSLPWHISRFHPDFEMVNKEITPKETLLEAYNIARKVGLKYVYLGNIQPGIGNNTVCPKCGKVLIKREGYKIKKCGLYRGKCKYCQEKIFGIWN